jgi:hypothetical protein
MAMQLNTLRFVQPWLVSLALCVLCATTAEGAVYLNGVNIEGLTNQKIDGVTVEIDGKGDVYLTAKNIKVQQVDVAPKPVAVAAPVAAMPAPAASSPPTPAASAIPQGPPPTRRYYLASEHNGPGMAQYDIDVFINGAWVRRLAHTEGQVVLEVTPQLRAGKNTIHFSAQKRIVGDRKSTSPLHTMTVHLGEGKGNGSQVTIEDVQIEYARTAAELQNFEDDRVLVAR